MNDATAVRTTDRPARGADEGASQGPEPEGRGHLSVRAHALQHIVETVALEVPQVRRTEGALAGVRSGTPRAHVHVRGTTARVSLDVSVAWPAPVSDVAAQVRSRVLDRASELSGVRITSVDVTVSVSGIDERRAS
ncbi:Asp23/Gls24 family envelope stress response protein [Nocardioides zhouii]|uniref:Asp23/Gls24 family envelope stress response protein n=1 Tax=Nocardioides zhouii TaxID=1168729 RepID=UPI0013EA4C96|nr:Asp23/Gls24 family envelope stress response protein [Nocardioides zhouii]